MGGHEAPPEPMNPIAHPPDEGGDPACRAHLLGGTGNDVTTPESEEQARRFTARSRPAPADRRERRVRGSNLYAIA